MQLINFEQDSPEWHEWRLIGIGASEAGAIMESPHAYLTKYQLYLEKTQQAEPADLELNPYVRRGKNREEEVRAAARHHLKTLPEYGPNISIEPACAEHDEYSFIHASFDSLIDDKVPVELKFLSDTQWDMANELGERSPAYELHRFQVMQQCLVAGIDHGWLMLYKEGGYLIPFRMSFTKAEFDTLKQALIAFWDQVLNFIAPPKDRKRDYYAPEQLLEQMQWRSLSRKYAPVRKRRLLLEAQIDELKEKEQPYLEQFVELLNGHYKARFAGVQVNLIVKAGRVDYKAYAQALEDTLASFASELQQQGITLPDAESFRKDEATSIRGGLYKGKTLDDRISEVSNPSVHYF